jgi:23S rRNA-/tRNA-specific pseudouridylate synthase
MLSSWLVPVLKFDAVECPRIVHRLDKDTTGILVLARTRRAAAEMYQNFHKQLVQKKVRVLIKLGEPCKSPRSHILFILSMWP